jgi:hypothetical protein
MRMLNFMGPRRVSVTVAGLLLAVNGAQADDASRMVLHKDDALVVRAHVQAGVNLIGEQALFWNLADIFAQSSNYDPDKVWFEGYVKPGISFESRVDPNSSFYGKFSGVWSGTIGIDAYDWGDTGRVKLTFSRGKFHVSDGPKATTAVSGGKGSFAAVTKQWSLSGVQQTSSTDRQSDRFDPPRTLNSSLSIKRTVIRCAYTVLAPESAWQPASIAISTARTVSPRLIEARSFR